MDENVERRIRDRAYRIWEEEGQPAGRDVDHWLRAAQEIAAEDHASDGTDQAAPPAAEAAAAKPTKAKRTRTPRATIPAPSAAKPTRAPRAENPDAAEHAPAGAGNAETTARRRRSTRSA